jgi:hypothetical protein
MPDPDVITQILASDAPDTVPDMPEIPAQPMPADGDDDAADEEDDEEDDEEEC